MYKKRRMRLGPTARPGPLASPRAGLGVAAASLQCASTAPESDVLADGEINVRQYVEDETSLHLNDNPHSDAHPYAAWILTFTL